MLPDLTGWSCVVGIDYAMISDWVSVTLHFKRDEMRYDINHSWICSKSKDLQRIKAPWKSWVDKGYCTYVDDVEISPEIVAQYIQEVGKQYQIEKVALDSYRYALVAESLKKIGFSAEDKNLRLITRSDIMKYVPVIDSCFVNQYYAWGDNPVLRWACNNAKLIPYGKQKGRDQGSFVYGKQEAKSRKTDPWLSLVAAQICEDEIVNYIPVKEGAKVILTI